MHILHLHYIYSELSVSKLQFSCVCLMKEKELHLLHTFVCMYVLDKIRQRLGLFK